MGWKGTLRSIQAASRRMEREAERERKAANKRHQLESAAAAVEDFEDRIKSLVSLHKDGTDPVDWEAAVSAPAPVKPEYSDKLEKQSENAWKTYTPNFFVKLFKKWPEENKQKLFDKIAPAKQKDEANFKAAVEKHELAFKEWADEKKLAGRVLAGERSGYLDALREVDPFSHVSALGSSVSFNTNGKDSADASLKVHGESAIPSEARSLTSSGKLTVKAMPKARFYEIYQDYVCSCALRISRDLFAVLPLQTVAVHIIENMLNRQTGHLEDQTILSVMVPRATLETLNMELIDPSDALRNFKCNMLFTKTKGFAAVERLTIL